jgi:hypothetical protein
LAVEVVAPPAVNVTFAVVTTADVAPMTAEAEEISTVVGTTVFSLVTEADDVPEPLVHKADGELVWLNVLLPDDSHVTS